MTVDELVRFAGARRQGATQPQRVLLAQATQARLSLGLAMSLWQHLYSMP